MRTLLLAASLLLPAAALAQGAQSPDRWVKEVTEMVFAAYRADPEVQKGSDKRMLAIMQSKAAPQFDFQRITRLAAGRYWLSASPEQKAALVREFSTLLMRTYYRSLYEYRNTAVELKPLRVQPGDTDVIVKTVFVRPPNPAFAVDFSVWQTPQGWRIYDISVEGISALANYRTVFAKEIQTSGMDGLIKSLATRNRQASATAGAR
jgi:phospholipid transport system substrate-binding protein